MQPANTPYHKFINTPNIGCTIHNCQRQHENNYFNKSKMCQLIMQQHNVGQQGSALAQFFVQHLWLLRVNALIDIIFKKMMTNKMRKLEESHDTEYEDA